MSFDKFESCHCLCVTGTGDLEAPKTKTVQSGDIITTAGALLFVDWRANQYENKTYIKRATHQ